MIIRKIILFSFFCFLHTSNHAQEWVDVFTTKFGKQILYRDSNNTALNGHFKMATSYDGRYSEINVKNGKLEGERKDFNRDGKLVKTEEYENGFLHGKTRDYYLNGTIRKETHYVQGILHGTNTGFDTKGKEISTEHYKNGLKVGKWVAKTKKIGTSTYVTITKFYTEGKPSGTWSEVGEHKKLIWSKKYFNVDHYRKREYYDNGQLKKEITHKDGKISGVWKTYYKNGILKSKWVYNDGKQTYRLDNNEEGKPKFIGHYKDGKSHGKHSHYDANNIIIMQGNYREGKRNGIWKFNTDIKRITSYKNGKKHGVEKIYTNDDTLFSEGTYANNIKHGPWKYYNKEQKVTREISYKNGKKVKDKK